MPNPTLEDSNVNNSANAAYNDLTIAIMNSKKYKSTNFYTKINIENDNNETYFKLNNNFFFAVSSVIINNNINKVPVYYEKNGNLTLVSDDIYTFSQTLLFIPKNVNVVFKMNKEIEKAECMCYRNANYINNIIIQDNDMYESDDEITENAIEITENAIEITENAIEITENAVETTENAVETTENAVETTDELIDKLIGKIINEINDEPVETTVVKPVETPPKPIIETPDSFTSLNHLVNHMFRTNSFRRR